MTPTDVTSTLDYVARCPECGHLVAWMSSSMPARDIAKEVAKWIRGGLELERMGTEEARGRLKSHAETCSKAKRRKT